MNLFGVFASYEEAKSS